MGLAWEILCCALDLGRAGSVACGRLNLVSPSHIPALCRPAFIPAFRLSQRFLFWGFGAAPVFACRRCASFGSFWPLVLASQAPPAIILAALRRFRGALPFRGLRPSSRLGAPFWPSGLTIRRSRPPTAAAELRALGLHFSMRVEYKNTFFGIFLFQAVHQFLSPALQALFGVLWALIFWTESLDGPAALAAAVALVFWVAMWLAQFLVNAIYLASKSNRTFLTTHIVEVQDEGLYEETEFNKSLFFWPGIIKAVSRPGFLAIYISGQQAHVVPKRAFASKSEMESFFQRVVSKIAQANDQA